MAALKLKSVNEYNDRIEAYFTGETVRREAMARTEYARKKKAEAEAHPNGFACPTCGSEMGDVSGCSISGAVVGLPCFTYHHTETHCPKCAHDAWRITKVHYYDGVASNALPTSDLAAAGVEPSKAGER